MLFFGQSAEMQHHTNLSGHSGGAEFGHTLNKDNNLGRTQNKEASQGLKFKANKPN